MWINKVNNKKANFFTIIIGLNLKIFLEEEPTDYIIYKGLLAQNWGPKNF